MFIDELNPYILVVDIGNTNIVCAVFQAGKILKQIRLNSDDALAVDAYYSLISRELADFSVSDISYIGIASVVPKISTIFTSMFEQYTKAQVFEIDALKELSLGYELEDRAAIGADLVANAIAAHRLYDKDCIVIDMGTSTTIQLVSKVGVYMGVIIAPGLKSSAESLVARAARLSLSDLSLPTVLLGKNTKDSMMSGIVGGHLRMIESTVWEICKEYYEQAPFKVILTGGLANLILPILPHGYIFEPALTLKGLYFAVMELIQIPQ